jgi:hypothetical protein
MAKCRRVVGFQVDSLARGFDRFFCPAQPIEDVAQPDMAVAGLRRALQTDRQLFERRLRVLRPAERQSFFKRLVPLEPHIPGNILLERERSLAEIPVAISCAAVFKTEVADDAWMNRLRFLRERRDREIFPHPVDRRAVNAHVAKGFLNQIARDTEIGMVRREKDVLVAKIGLDDVGGFEAGRPVTVALLFQVKLKKTIEVDDLVDVKRDVFADRFFGIGALTDQAVQIGIAQLGRVRAPLEIRQGNRFRMRLAAERPQESRCHHRNAVLGEIGRQTVNVDDCPRFRDLTDQHVGFLRSVHELCTRELVGIDERRGISGPRSHEDVKGIADRPHLTVADEYDACHSSARRWDQLSFTSPACAQ